MGVPSADATLTPGQLQQALSVYTQFDGAMIGRGAVKQGLRLLGAHATDSELDGLLEALQYEADAATCLSVGGWLALVQGVKAAHAAAARPDAELMEAFASLGGQPDGQGHIQASKLGEVADAFELGFDTQAFAADLDEDGDGEVSYAEFAALLVEEPAGESSTCKGSVAELVVDAAGPEPACPAEMSDLVARLLLGPTSLLTLAAASRKRGPAPAPPATSADLARRADDIASRQLTREEDNEAATFQALLSPAPGDAPAAADAGADHRGKGWVVVAGERVRRKHGGCRFGNSFETPAQRQLLMQQLQRRGGALRRHRSAVRRPAAAAGAGGSAVFRRLAEAHRYHPHEVLQGLRQFVHWRLGADGTRQPTPPAAFGPDDAAHGDCCRHRCRLRGGSPSDAGGCPAGAAAAGASVTACCLRGYLDSLRRSPGPGLQTPPVEAKGLFCPEAEQHRGSGRDSADAASRGPRAKSCSIPVPSPSDPSLRLSQSEVPGNRRHPACSVSTREELPGDSTPLSVQLYLSSVGREPPAGAGAVGKTAPRGTVSVVARGSGGGDAEAAGGRDARGGGGGVPSFSLRGARPASAAGSDAGQRGARGGRARVQFAGDAVGGANPGRNAPRACDQCSRPCGQCPKACGQCPREAGQGALHAGAGEMRSAARQPPPAAAPAHRKAKEPRGPETPAACPGDGTRPQQLQQRPPRVARSGGEPRHRGAAARHRAAIASSRKCSGRAPGRRCVGGRPQPCRNGGAGDRPRDSARGRGLYSAWDVSSAALFEPTTGRNRPRTAPSSAGALRRQPAADLENAFGVPLSPSSEVPSVSSPRPSKAPTARRPTKGRSARAVAAAVLAVVCCSAAAPPVVVRSLFEARRRSSSVRGSAGGAKPCPAAADELSLSSLPSSFFLSSQSHHYYDHKMAFGASPPQRK
ncbi:Dynein 18 kDa light chain [Diplonema papillatum]|nr:Dynein 18 kDa light chain [Diplonema papillatum]